MRKKAEAEVLSIEETRTQVGGWVGAGFMESYLGVRKYHIDESCTSIIQFVIERTCVLHAYTHKATMRSIYCNVM